MGDDVIKSRVEGSRLVVETAAGTEEYEMNFLVAVLLVYVARGSGQIEPEESAEMIGLIESQFNLPGAESLELITRAMTDMAEKREPDPVLARLGPALSESDQEDIAVMALKVVAADGQREFAEIERFNRAMQAAGIGPEVVHRAFDRYFAETMPGQ